MTIRERVARTKTSLVLLASASAAVWGAVAAVAAFVLIELIAAVTAPGTSVGVLRSGAILVGIAVAGLLAWRERFVWAIDRVALWIEERIPELRYSLVTASEARYVGVLDHVAQPILDRGTVDALVRRAALRSLLPGLAALAGVVAVTILIPQSWKESLQRSSSGRFGRASTSALLAGSKLTPLHVRVIAPFYARLRDETVDEPSTIAGLQGSRVVLEGSGSSAGLVALLSAADGRHLKPAVTGNGDRWNVAFAMADTTPSFLEIMDRNYKREIVVNPRADAAPVVKLRLPARDTALRVSAGVLRLSADVTDDVGLASGQFEYIISSGSEETFTFKQGAFGAAQLHGEKTWSLSATVPYSFFKLNEGDRISIRAVASDLNSVSGPGKGYSETRTIRIARKDEYDSLSVEAAAPSGDTAMMSLRMLIIETERLDSARLRISRESLVARAGALARQTDQVRAAVLPLFRDEGGDAPEITMDTESTERSVQVVGLVRAALNDLEEASRKLDVAEPHSSLPPMYKAYKALQSFRNFKRYYLRGATRPVIVDIQRVRLTGKTKGAATPMTPRTVATSDRDRMRVEYSAAIEQLRSAPGKAVTMLTLLRVESLKKYAPLSAAIEDALTAIDKGRDATGALLRARRLLEGSPATSDSLSAWSGGW